MRNHVADIHCLFDLQVTKFCNSLQPHDRYAHVVH